MFRGFDNSNADDCFHVDWLSITRRQNNHRISFLSNVKWSQTFLQSGRWRLDSLLTNVLVDSRKFKNKRQIFFLDYNPQLSYCSLSQQITIEISPSLSWGYCQLFSTETLVIILFPIKVPCSFSTLHGTSAFPVCIDTVGEGGENLDFCSPFPHTVE